MASGTKLVKGTLCHQVPMISVSMHISACPVLWWQNLADRFPRGPSSSRRGLGLTEPCGDAKKFRFKTRKLCFQAVMHALLARREPSTRRHTPTLRKPSVRSVRKNAHADRFGSSPQSPGQKVPWEPNAGSLQTRPSAARRDRT
jgi:hypothetical protein